MTGVLLGCRRIGARQSERGRTTRRLLRAKRLLLLGVRAWLAGRTALCHTGVRWWADGVVGKGPWAGKAILERPSTKASKASTRSLIG